MDKDEYIKALEKLKYIPEEDSERLIQAAAVITDYVKAAYNIDLIVVGGLSVEIYTEGGYTTQDIDFVGIHHEKIMQAMTDLGFRRNGKDSVHDSLHIYVEVPGSVLKDADEKYVNSIRAANGFKLRVIGIEDIIKDRLVALVQWDDKIQSVWIYQLIKSHINKLDVSYIQDTLGEEEWQIFNSYLRMLRKDNLPQQMQTEIINFLDLNTIPYVNMDGIIALATKNTYYGFTVAPSIMGYTYEEDEYDNFFVTISEDELSLDELLDWMRSIGVNEVKRIDEVISFIEELND